MNFDCNVSLAGQYTLYDENMNVLGETENLITDWGMRRFVGDRSTGAPHPADTDDSQLAFVNNMRYIMLGTGSTGYGSESYSNFKLVSAISPSEYVERNVQATTGTQLTSHPTTGDLMMIFTRLTRFEMASSFNTAAAPLSTYAVNEIGCSWSQTFSADNRYGIFSRATLNTPVIIKPNNVVYAKYELTVRTDANQIKGSMTRFNGTGAVNLPANKTNVRELPLFTLKSDGTSGGTINNGDSLLGAYSIPMFEDAGNANLTYTNSSDNSVGDRVFGNHRQRLWWLQFYTSNWSVAGSLSATKGGAFPSERYNTFVSTTTATLNPVTNLSVHATNLNNYGATTYDGVVAQNLNPYTTNITGRKKHEVEILAKTNSNTWRRTIRFLFSPNELQQKITVLNLYRTALGDWDYTWYYFVNWWIDRRYVGYDINANHNFGLVTVLNAEYNPNPSLYDGFEYVFTYSRA